MTTDMLNQPGNDEDFKNAVETHSKLCASIADVLGDANYDTDKSLLNAIGRHLNLSTAMNSALS